MLQLVASTPCTMSPRWIVMNVICCLWRIYWLGAKTVLCFICCNCNHSTNFTINRLALYVYEYLLHVGAQKAAQTFLSEIRWEKNITLGEPPGFLHSWWWCVHNNLHLIIATIETNRCLLTFNTLVLFVLARQCLLGSVLRGARTSGPMRSFIRSKGVSRLRFCQLWLQWPWTRKCFLQKHLRNLSRNHNQIQFVSSERRSSTKSTGSNATKWRHSWRSGYGTEFFPGKSVSASVYLYSHCRFIAGCVCLNIGPFIIWLLFVIHFWVAFRSHQDLHLYQKQQNTYVFVLICFSFHTHEFDFVIDHPHRPPPTKSLTTHTQTKTLTLHHIPWHTNEHTNRTRHTQSPHTIRTMHRTMRRCGHRRPRIQPANNHHIHSRRPTRTIKWCHRLVDAHIAHSTAPSPSGVLRRGIGSLKTRWKNRPLAND